MLSSQPVPVNSGYVNVNVNADWTSEDSGRGRDEMRLRYVDETRSDFGQETR